MQDGPVRKRNGLFRHEHGLSRLISESGASVDTPAGLVFTVYRELSRSTHFHDAAFALEPCGKGRLRWVEIGAGFRELDLCNLVRIIRWSGLRLKLGEHRKTIQ